MILGTHGEEFVNMGSIHGTPQKDGCVPELQLASCNRVDHLSSKHPILDLLFRKSAKNILCTYIYIYMYIYIYV